MEKINIDPLNRAYLFFNVIPEYKADLNDQKNRLSITFYNTELTDDLKLINSPGIIEEVQSSIDQKDVKTIISLSQEDKGFTILPLPFSSSLMVDFFTWSKLEKGEKELKLAIFGIEDKIQEEEEIYANLDIAIREGISEAKAIKGIYQISKGIGKNSSELIFSANKDSVKIPDLYACISMILKSKGNDTLANQYLKRFTKLTGKTQIPELLVDDLNQITIPDYFYKKKTMSSIVQKDSLNIPLGSSRTKQGFLESIGFNPTYLIFFAFALILVFVLIYLNYLKWKKNQMENKELGDAKFKEELRQKKIESEKKIQELKSKSKQDDSKPKQQKPKQKSEPKPSNVLQQKYKKDDVDKVDLKQKKVRPTENIKEVTNKEKLEDFLVDYIPIKRKLDKEEKKNNNSDLDEVEPKDSSQSPNMDLALKIASEKQKNKQQQLINLSKQKLDDDSALEEKAKELGVEKGSIEAKSMIDNLGSDEKSLSKLRDKFNVKNNQNDSSEEDSTNEEKKKENDE